MSKNTKTKKPIKAKKTSRSSRTTKKKNSTKSTPKVYKKNCIICKKPFKTCNPSRKVCDVCCETPSKIKKIKVEIKKNRDGVTKIRECVACGQTFVTCSDSRVRCTSCSCDDYGIKAVDVKQMFEIGNEPNRSMPWSLMVRCHNCILNGKCNKPRTKGIMCCPSGEWVTCAKCAMQEVCEIKGHDRKNCHHGIRGRMHREEDSEDN